MLEALTCSRREDGLSCRHSLTSSLVIAWLSSSRQRPDHGQFPVQPLVQDAVSGVTRDDAHCTGSKASVPEVSQQESPAGALLREVLPTNDRETGMPSPW